MYSYAASASLFDGVSNIYVISTATVFLAVIIALYCANFLKDFGETATATVDVDETDFIEEDAQIENLDDETQSSVLKTLTLQASQENENSDESESEMQSDGLVSKLKSAHLRELEAQLTQQQLEDERRIEREQLSAIFELLKKQEAELNMKEIDESELAAQLHLYR